MADDWKCIYCGGVGNNPPPDWCRTCNRWLEGDVFAATLRELEGRALRAGFRLKVTLEPLLKKKPPQPPALLRR